MNLQNESFVQRDKETILAILTSVELIASAPLTTANEWGVPWAIYKCGFGKSAFVDIMHIENHHGFPDYEISLKNGVRV